MFPIRWHRRPAGVRGPHRRDAGATEAPAVHQDRPDLVRGGAELVDEPAVVVVGDRKVIEPGISALNLGPVRAMSVDEAIGQ